ncbi:MAG: hypothetical protein HY823_15440 [Acidobacteria bacterium]|nr:hypothetical protein [Acidobacteriota bacterium]
MAAISCPQCGADLTQPQSVRVAEYHFGRLDPSGETGGPGFAYRLEQPDTYTILCSSCKRLVRTLPLEKKG